MNEIPGMIVDHINTRAKIALEGKSRSVTKGQMEDELIVLGLAWSKKLCCLVHRSGIGKRMDACDTEHMLCMVYVMYQNTFPNKKNSKSHMDSPKYFPTKTASADRIAKKSPSTKNHIMSFKEKYLSYVKLLLDESYVHCNLDDIYRIDIC